jgi:isopentenyl diphosphate isomerase/L-lactate dehydrogenase-like FMN-dependent dehydrogenase
LPEIVEEVGNEIDVYIDGGVRSGNDVFKALAIGAKAVFIGRPVIWGLIHDVIMREIKLYELNTILI